MNERIKELKHRAEELAYEEHKANCIKNGVDPSLPHANALNMTFEKFAELIVKECIKQAHGVGDLRGVNDDMIYGADTAALRISKHFGIK